MPLNDFDLEAMLLLFQEEIEPLRQEMNRRFDTVAEQLDGLYQGNEKQEQEYLFTNEQTSRLEKRVEELAKKSA